MLKFLQKILLMFFGVLISTIIIMVTSCGNPQDIKNTLRTESTNIKTQTEESPPPEERYGVPNLISPVKGAILDNGRSDRKDSITWDFFWSEVPGATQYQLYVIGNTTVIPGIIPVINTQTTTMVYHRENQGSYIANQNRFGWTWKVRAEVNGVWNEWSEVRTFDVEPLDTDPPWSTTLPMQTSSLPVQSTPSPVKTTPSPSLSISSTRVVRVYTTPS